MAHHYDDEPRQERKALNTNESHSKLSYSKEFAYGQHKFNIQVKLDHANERIINGRRLHRVTCNDMGPNNYIKYYEAEGLYELKRIIKLAEQDAMDWVNNTEIPLSEAELLLKQNGFS